MAIMLIENKSRNESVIGLACRMEILSNVGSLNERFQLGDPSAAIAADGFPFPRAAENRLWQAHEIMRAFASVYANWHGSKPG
jgi:hypothetical protein